jgi:threonylcarbamoyladenosine tRNA methylthiotransferase MtaB
MAKASAEPAIISLGCRLNAGEAAAMRQHAAVAGLGEAVIVNTCAVTAEAVRQGAQEIRRLRREQPGARLIVTGCAAQIEPQRYAAMAEVDHVIGNAEKMAPATFEQLSDNGRAPRVLVGDIMAVREAAPGPVDAPVGLPRAFVQIQNGCDHTCTFCVIPFGRGRSRSVPAEDVIARVRALVEAGVPEVVLTGVDITSWGRDLPDGPPLGRLVRRVLGEVPALARLRISSIDQAEADPELMAAIAEEERLMPHLHLSLQAGADLILKRMKRRHSRAEAVAFCKEVRRLRPGIALGADLIAGFPTETEAHFRDTLDLVDACGLVLLHVFPYSVRRDTPAARMPSVPGDVIRERAARLREKGRAVLGDWLDGFAGRRIEAALERAGAATVPARTPQFAQVVVTGVEADLRAGTVVPARVVRHEGRRLMAEVVQ